MASSTPQSGNPYLRTRVMTARPEQLRLMLFDGALKFCRQAKQHLVNNNFEGMYEGLVRAQKIVLELTAGLNHQADPELCSRLAGLYNYIYRRLVDANTERDPAGIDEAVQLLEFERETWQLLLKKLDEHHQAGQDPVAEARVKLEQEQNNPIARIGETPTEAAPPPPPTDRPAFSAEG